MDQASSPDNIIVNLNKNDKPSNNDSKQHFVFFIFVNPTSGGNKASVLTKLDVENMMFPVFNKEQAQVEVNFHDLKDTRSRETGFRNLKIKQRDEKLDIRVIVGGGDGTIMWVIEEMVKAQIPFDNIPIGCIPFGTGNDFSRVLGWGGQEPDVLIGPHFNGLKRLITKWIDAVPQDFDIWEITFDVYDEGGIRRILKNGNKTFEKKFMMVTDPSTGQERKVLRLTKKMCNYYSFGIDARIGYGFDKFRTTSRVKNKMVYCWEGFKKLFLKTLKVNHILHTVQNEQEDKIKIEHDVGEEQKIDKIEYRGKDFVLYPSGTKTAKPNNASIIKGNPSVFLCLNIPSYMGGASNPWKSSKGKVGVTDDQNKTLADFEDQMFGDGKLEIISFNGAMNLAMERFIHGQGRRVGQAEGPFVLNFIRSENHEKPLFTYMQIDGEFFQLVAPRSVKIGLAKDIPRGKVRVLVNNNLKKK